jgi:hypothetical protein
MKRWLIFTLLLTGLLLPGPALPAEITEVLDAADGEDPIDINLDVGFRSVLNRSKITHEAAWYWQRPGYTDRPDFNELRFEQQIYAMDYTFQIGLYHDVELYANLPWIIQDKRSISWVGGVTNTTSTLFQLNPTDPDYPGDSLAVDPTDNPSTKRSGIGDIQVGFRWAAFNDERDDTKSVWIIGLDYTIPSGKLAKPAEVAGGSEGSVGLGQHVITPFMLFSHRYKVLDPYIGLHGSIPIQGREAKNAGFESPYWGGFLVGMEIIPWENRDKHQKFAIDVRLTTDFFSEVESKGHEDEQGYVNEISDFLAGWNRTSNRYDSGLRQLQAMGNYTQFGLNLGFVIRAAEFVRLRFGVSLAHNTEHFLTGADYCDDKTGEGECDQSEDIQNTYRNLIYDDPGRRIRVEETTIFTWWVTGMLTF